MSRPAVSGAPLDAAPAPPAAAGLEPGGRIGVGGMGEVLLARDRNLGREVAYKRARRPEDDARLAHEARVTAGLEHPGIVPVYQAGVDEEGRPFYAMRLLTGPTLHEAIAQAHTDADRTALVRRLLDVADAVAYAHHRGVLHLDLKPANILVGPYGETVVTDWGLAATPGLAHQGGTPGFMAPEQRDGGLVDARADVYATGAVLAAILDGHGPPELAAIVERATAHAPADRYPGMDALRADLAAWFEGRRVSAHRYSRRELVGRFVSAWRAPLLVGAAALIALTATLAGGWWRTSIERERAIKAETVALDQLQAALLAQMRVAVGDGLEIEAAVIAARALQTAPAPDARGVLARVLDKPSINLVGRQPLPGCLHRALSFDGRYVACAGPDTLTWFDADTGEHHTTPARVAHLAFAGPGGPLVAAHEDGSLLRWSPPAAPEPMGVILEQIFLLRESPIAGTAVYIVSAGAGLIDAVHNQRLPTRHCLVPASRPSSAVASTDGHLTIVCTDGVLLDHPPDGGQPRVVTHLAPTRSAPRVLADGPDGELLIGTPTGELILVDHGKEQRWETEAPIRQLAVSSRAIAVLTDDGALQLIARDAPAPFARLRVGDARFRWTDQGGRLRVVGDHVDDWSMPSERQPDSWRFNAGLAAIAIGPGWLAAGQGDGRIDVITVPDGAPVRQLWWGATAIKDVAAAPGRLAVASIQDGPEPVFRTDTWEAAHHVANGPHRRIAWLPDGTQIGARYKGGVTRDAEGQSLPWLSDAAIGDLEVRGPEIAALDIYNQVWRLDGTPRSLGSVGESYAVAPAGDNTLVALAGSLNLLDPAGALIRVTPIDGTPLDVVVSTSGRWAAVGMLDGDVRVLRVADGVEVARLIAHTGRVAALAFSDDDRWLYTGSWDHTARRWSTRVFEADLPALQAEIDQRWGLELDEVLAGLR